ncbi:MAG: hypothetical protein RBS37_02970 [Bacteroidales bacterium]|jgi:hypothetical protein|nr:hypothetical protein [Bacteroidales bacterium]
MSESCCPNIGGCKLVNDREFPIDERTRKHYIGSWCHGYTPGYEACRRYIVRNTLFYCPDFILPDTTMSLDEIIDRIETEG